MIRTILLIARWEYLRRFLTKPFLISLLLPFIFIILTVIPQYMLEQNMSNSLNIGILSNEESVYFEFNTFIMDTYSEQYELELIPVTYSNKEVIIKELLNNQIKDIIIEFPDNYLESSEYPLYSKSLEESEINRLEEIINIFIKEMKLNNMTLSPDQMTYLNESISFKIQSTNGKNSISLLNGQDETLLPMIFVFILIIGTLTSAQVLISSTIEEKSHHIVGILLATISSRELMQGKILGVGLLGLTQIFFYMAVLFGSSVYFSGAFLEINMISIIDVIWYLVFFMSGYLLYSSLFITIGALFDNERDAHQLSGIVALFMLIPMYFISYIVEQPEALLTNILAFIPFMTPIFMIIQIGFFQLSSSYIVSMLVYLIFWIFIFSYLSGKIFRTAILMQGKRKTFSEILRWIRYSD